VRESVYACVCERERTSKQSVYNSWLSLSSELIAKGDASKQERIAAMEAGREGGWGV